MLVTTPGNGSAQCPAGKNAVAVQAWGAGGGGSANCGGGGGGHSYSVLQIEPDNWIEWYVGTGGLGSNHGGSDLGQASTIGFQSQNPDCVANGGIDGANGGAGGVGVAGECCLSHNKGGAGCANGGGGGVGRADIDGGDATTTAGGMPCGGAPGVCGVQPGGGGGVGENGGHGQVSYQWLVL